MHTLAIGFVCHYMYDIGEDAAIALADTIARRYETIVYVRNARGTLVYRSDALTMGVK